MSKPQGLEPTVANFLLVLEHELIRYDMKQKDNNIYRLGHLLGASGKVRADMRALFDSVNLSGNMTQAIAEYMIKSVGTHFEKGFSPINKVVRQITEFLASGKRPTLK